MAIDDKNVDEETKENHGNTKLPYGLAKEEGINTKGLTPRQVWGLLEDRGISPPWSDSEQFPDAVEDITEDFFEREDKTKNGIKSAVVKKKYNMAKEAYKKITLTGIEKSFAGEIEHRLLDLANTYGVDFSGMEVKATANKREFGHHTGQLDRDSKNNIYFKDSLTYSNLNMRDRNTSSIKHQSEAKYRGSKNTSELGTVDHEIAHAIDIQYAIKSDTNLKEAVDFYNGVKLANNLLERNKQIQHINDINDMIHSDERNLSGKVKRQLMSKYNLDERGFRELVKKEIGTYALTNTSEFFAEGFSAYRNIPKENQTEFVKKIGEYTEKNIREVFENGKAR